MDTIADWLIGIQGRAATRDVLRVDLFGKLTLATILGVVIGWERAASGRIQETLVDTHGIFGTFRMAGSALGCAGLLQSVDAPGAAV